MITPLHDRILVVRDNPEGKSAGGIILPDASHEEKSTGKVIAVGPGKKKPDGSRELMDVEVGDEILFAKYAGTEFTVKGRTLTVVREEDVFVKLGEANSEQPAPA